MSRSAHERLDDIVDAVTAIKTYLAGGSLEEAVVVDAVRMRLLEIGEAVKGLDADLLETEPGIPWKQVARMRDHLAHRYFLSSVEIIAETVDRDLGPLLGAVDRLRWRTNGDQSA